MFMQKYYWNLIFDSFVQKDFFLKFDKKRDFLIKLIILFGGKVVESLNF